MSDTQAYEEIPLDADGVSVVKRYEKDDFPVPAIAFSFESEREVAVTVTLWDEVPDEVAVEDLGFHPEYGSEHWDILDDEITFEREIGPGDDYTTVYGIRATGTDNIDQFLTVPTIEVDPPAMSEEDLVGDDAAVKEVISGEAEDVPGLEDEDVDTLDLKDPNEEGAADDESEDVANADDENDVENDVDDGGDANDGESDASDDESVGDVDLAVDGDSLVEAMANELRQNDVSKEDVKLLRKAFDLAAEDKGSVRAKVKKLQQDVSEVIAYTDALEEFLDENGTAEDIGDFQENFEGIQSELESVERRVDEQAEEIDALAEDVSAVEDDVGGVDDTVEEFESQIDGLEADLEDLRDQLGSTDVDEEIEDIEAEIEQLKEWREQLSSVIGGE